MNLNILYLEEDASRSPEQRFEKLANCPRYQLTNQSWPEIPTRCGTDFTIAHTGQEILVNFNIENDYFRAVHRKVNTDVHLDNCVEFFIAFDESDDYYNIEFNCLGIGKVAYGGQKVNRKLLPEPIVRKIRTLIKSEHRETVFNWNMIMTIPAEVFIYHQIQNFEGIIAKANFYKCGDALPNPHYLCWNKVLSPVPDFHRPECFGALQFMAPITERSEI